MSGTHHSIFSLSSRSSLVLLSLTLLAGSGLIARPAQAQVQNLTLLPYEDSETISLSSDGGATFFNADAGRYTAQFGSGPITNIYCVDPE